MPQPADDADTGVSSLATAMTVLAQTPDDMPDIDRRLGAIARLAADRVDAADYASVTVLRDDTYSTVAASSAIAEAVDAAQYDERDGPCLEALDSGVPVTVHDVTDLIKWPGFRTKTAELGLHASVSIPLFAGSGRTIAALNLYGRDATAMAPLIAGVWAVCRPDRPLPGDHEDLRPLDPGGAELLAGLAEALAVHAAIQLALGVIMARDDVTAGTAYLTLRLHGAATGTGLLTAASDVVVSADHTRNEDRHE